MHINTLTNDSVAVTEFPSAPLLLTLLSREKSVVAISQRNEVFRFGLLHTQAQIYITYSHGQINMYTLTPAYLQKATKTNIGLHFSLLLQGIPSVNMT